MLNVAHCLIQAPELTVGLNPVHGILTYLEVQAGTYLLCRISILFQILSQISFIVHKRIHLLKELSLARSMFAQTSLCWSRKTPGTLTSVNPGAKQDSLVPVLKWLPCR